MADAGQDKTALGIARARFMDGLPRKAKELKGAVTLLVGTPGAERPREEMRRRLHALYASAQVFQEEQLALALRDGIQRLDNAREQQRPLHDDDLDVLVELASQLPNLGSGRSGVASVSTRGQTAGRAVPPPVPTAPPTPRAQEPQRVSKVSKPPVPGQAVSAQPPAQPSEVISVLVVDDAEAEAQVRRALPLDQFEVIATHDPEEALRLARAAAPDVVLVGHEAAASGSELIGRLRADPLTDFVPVILLWATDAVHDPDLQAAVGADDSLRKPVDPPSLLRRIAALTASPGRFGGAIDSLHEGTVEQVADRVAREIRQGIVDSVQTGRDQSISLGDGTDILAAAWSAVGRIRSHLAQRSGGRVSFRDAPRRGGPAMLALVNEDASDDDEISEQLKGRRVLVADDDPAVLWFFAGVLKEAGAVVIEAADGRVALEQTRRHRPDVVVSDILMPEVDGFALCRELKRDVAVADIPVILLSWKEDFLQRMRELQSGASGYLLKESGARQILARIHEVLRPRLRLEEQLRVGGEVRGRIDGVGVMSLMETVANERPDARVTVRDAGNLFEADLRKGSLVTLSRTSTDGSFARGDLALRQLLGAKSARFTVSDSDAPVRAIFDLPLGRLLDDAARQLSALLDAVSDTHLMQIHGVEFDDPTLAAMVSTSPAPTRDILERLRSGASPRQLIIDGECAPQELETVLDDAARRGALTQVLGAGREDLVAAALAERERDLGALMHSNRPPATRPSQLPEPQEWPSSILKSEPPGPGLPGLPAALRESDQERELDLAFERGSIPPPIVVHSNPPPVPEAALRGRPLPQDLVAAAATQAAAEETPAATLDEPVSTVPEPGPASAPTTEGDSESTVAEASGEESGSGEDDALAAAPGVEAALADLFGESAQDAEPKVATETTEADTNAEPATTEAAEARERAALEGAVTQVAMPAVQQEPAVVATPPAASTLSEAGPSQTPTAQPAPTPARKELDTTPSVWSRALAFVAIAAVGFGGFSVLQQQMRTTSAAPDVAAATEEPANQLSEVADDEPGGTESDEDEDGEDTESASGSPAAPSAAPVPAAAAAATPSEPAVVEVPAERDVGFGRVLPYIDQSRNTPVPDGQGLLVVEANAEVPNARVRVGGRDLGVAPISSALPPGRHEVIFQRGDDSSFRYLVIRGGETRIVQVP